jgi:hypothetical protein
LVFDRPLPLPHDTLAEAHGQVVACIDRLAVSSSVLAHLRLMAWELCASTLQSGEGRIQVWVSGPEMLVGETNGHAPHNGVAGHNGHNGQDGFVLVRASSGGVVLDFTARGQVLEARARHMA